MTAFDKTRTMRFATSSFGGTHRKQAGRAEMIEDLANEIAARLEGPLHLRLMLQPTVALIIAMRDGRRDARDGAEPFFWAILFRKGQRRARIADAWLSVGKVFVLAIVLDSVFQRLTVGHIDFAMAVGMGVLLCAIPYTLVRGPVSRLGRR